MSGPSDSSRRFSSRRRSLPLVGLALVGPALLLTACPSKEGVELRGEVVKAGCGMCMFEMPGVRRCVWAVQFDDTIYLADGNLPKHHDAHGPGGMCTMFRKAVVSGTLIHGRFIASRFDLMPPAATPTDARAPRPHRH